MSPISKSIGPFTFSISDKGEGVFEASVALSATMGGGEAAGFLKLGGALTADLNAEQVAALGFEEFNKILPAAIEPLAEAGEAALEGEIKSL